MASSILAPSLKHITEVLALTWRARLTRVAHKAYLSRRTFYLTSQFAGLQVCCAGHDLTSMPEGHMCVFSVCWRALLRFLGSHGFGSKTCSCGSFECRACCSDL